MQIPGGAAVLVQVSDMQELEEVGFLEELRAFRGRGPRGFSGT